jgi:hypothetical protein
MLAQVPCKLCCVMLPVQPPMQQWRATALTAGTLRVGDARQH